MTGTIAIEDGHDRRLELPLDELTALVADPTVDVPDLGDSALVVELDDSVEAVEAPPRVADVDLLQPLGSARSTGQEGSQADEALLACSEQAHTEEQSAVCSGAA